MVTEPSLQTGSQEEKALSSDSGVSSICRDSDLVHVLQAVSTAGLKFGAEMGQTA